MSHGWLCVCPKGGWQRAEPSVGWLEGQPDSSMEGKMPCPYSQEFIHVLGRTVCPEEQAPRTLQVLLSCIQE